MHVEKMSSCVLMCCVVLCRTGDAQIHMLELAWRCLAWKSLQCLFMSETSFCLCIDGCVSLYHTRHASRATFKLAGNRFAKKRIHCGGLGQ